MNENAAARTASQIYNLVVGNYSAMLPLLIKYFLTFKIC